MRRGLKVKMLDMSQIEFGWRKKETGSDLVSLKKREDQGEYRDY